MSYQCRISEIQHFDMHFRNALGIINNGEWNTASRGELCENFEALTPEQINAVFDTIVDSTGKDVKYVCSYYLDKYRLHKLLPLCEAM